MKSALAVIAAIALIAGAFYVRTGFIEGDGGVTSGETDALEGRAGGDASDLAVACDALLADACPAGASRLDLAGLLDAFSAQPVEYDALVAPLVVVELIEQSQTSQATFGAEREAVALSPLVFTVAISRDEVVGTACDTSITWACAAQLIEGRQLQPALADPQTSSVGLAAVAALTGGFLGSPSYSTNAFSGAGFLSWLDAVDEQVETRAAPTQNLIATGGAQNDSAVELEATGLGTVRTSARDVADVSWPTPLALLHVVAVGVGGVDQAAVDGIGAHVAETLQANGWRGSDGAPTDSAAPRLDPAGEDGLPNGGTLFALRERIS